MPSRDFSTGVRSRERATTPERVEPIRPYVLNNRMPHESVQHVEVLFKSPEISRPPLAVGVPYPPSIAMSLRQRIPSTHALASLLVKLTKPNIGGSDTTQ